MVLRGRAKNSPEGSFASLYIVEIHPNISSVFACLPISFEDLCNYPHRLHIHLFWDTSLSKRQL